MKEQLLTLEEEKSTVRFCETLDELGQPVSSSLSMYPRLLALLSADVTLMTFPTAGELLIAHRLTIGAEC